MPNSLKHSIDLPSAQVPILERLRSTVSTETNILSVLDLSLAWFPPFQSYYSSLAVPPLNATLKVFVTHNLASENTLCLALALLCIATSLQILRPGIDDQDLYLSASSSELITRITATVDQLVLQDDTELQSNEGVLLLLLRSKLHSESNQLRKAWLGIRRALLVSQKIEVEGKLRDDDSWKRFYDGISNTDRVFSMFLGMPCAIAIQNEELSQVRELFDSGDPDDRVRNVWMVTALAAGMVNNRTTRLEDMALDRSLEIQAILDTATSSVPNEWWSLEANKSAVVDLATEFQKLTAQLWFFQTQCYLQLLFMLRSTSSPEFRTNRDICLDSARAVAKIWLILRSNPGFELYICKLDDFQCLVGAVTIIVGMLQGINAGKGEGEWMKDRKLIDEVRTLFRRLQREQNGSIARQGLHVLNTLSVFLSHRLPKGAEAVERKAVTLFVPYFGAIAVEVMVRNESIEKPKEYQNHISVSQTSPADMSFGDSLSLPSLEILPDSGVDQDFLYSYNDFDLSFGDPGFDWEKMMVGVELDQDWNGALL